MPPSFSVFTCHFGALKVQGSEFHLDIDDTQILSLAQIPPNIQATNCQSKQVLRPPPPRSSAPFPGSCWPVSPHLHSTHHIPPPHACTHTKSVSTPCRQHLKAYFLLPTCSDQTATCTSSFPLYHRPSPRVSVPLFLAHLLFSTNTLLSSDSESKPRLRTTPLFTLPRAHGLLPAPHIPALLPQGLCTPPHFLQLFTDMSQHQGGLPWPPI